LGRKDKEAGARKALAVDVKTTKRRANLKCIFPLNVTRILTTILLMVSQTTLFLFFAAAVFPEIRGFQHPSIIATGFPGSCVRLRSGPSGFLACKAENSAGNPEENQNRRTFLRNTAAITFFSLTTSPLVSRAAGQDLATSAEEIEGSDGLMTKISFAYPKTWKYERDVRIPTNPQVQI
jgi:hypothetical protein